MRMLWPRGMATPVRLWLEIAHLPGLRVGGWAWVLHDGAAVTGTAGGERRIEAGRAALMALLAALKAAPDGQPVTVRTRSPLLASAPQVLAKARAGEPPSADLDLWTQLDAVLSKRRVAIEAAPAAPATPSAFAAAWAELARDKAKGGAFSSAIPKTNLAKVQGLS
jgi:ribonuclease HI